MSQRSISGVRIVLDLELFFKDKRRKCYHYIDFSRNKIVGDVCKDIKSNFDVNTDIFLEINKFYVPEKQDVRILYDEDVVRVVDAGRRVLTIQCDEERHVSRDPEILTNTLSDEKNETMYNQAVNESDENRIISKPKKRKKSRTDETLEKKVIQEVVVDECENPKRKKKSIKTLPKSIPTEHEKCSHSKSEKDPDALNNSTAELTNFTCEVESTVKCDTEAEPVFTLKPEEGSVENLYKSTEELPREQTCKVDSEGGSCVSSATVKVNINGGERQDILLNSGGLAEVSEHLDTGSSKKRRRRRRQKPPRINHNFSEQHVTEFSVNAKSSFITPQHIKFVDEEEHSDFSNNTKPNNTGYNALDRSVLLQVSGESESSAIDNKSTAKNEYNIKSDCDVPINNTSNVRNSDISNNFVIQTSTTPMIFECKRTNKTLNNQTASKETETDFSKYPILNDAPKVNDIIAFKKLKMESNYCPSISQYISAKVLEVSGKDSPIILRILNGHEELKEPKGKFSLEEENEVDYFEEKIDSDAVEINLAELLDIRLLFP